MRQQYHSRTTGDGNIVWDVNQLAATASQLPVIEIAIKEIQELDETYWYQQTQSPTCRSVAEHAKLIHETDLAYPILLSSDGRVIDGMHRVCKALMLGHTHIQAKQFEVDPEAHYTNVMLDDLPYDDYKPL